MSRMTHSKCGDCRKYFKCDSACENDGACEGFEPRCISLFNRITQSPEVLAERLVYALFGERGETVIAYFSTIIPGISWKTYEEAIAATVARLKEVGNERAR